jgi:hypothetical protein
MRKPTMKLHLASLAVVVAVAACSDASANDARNDELKRDLELASTTMNLATPAVDPALLSAMETRTLNAPAQATVVKRGAGSRAVRSQNPTVEAAPENDLAAVDETEQVETESEAPAPDVSEPVAVAPRPQPVIIQTGGVGSAGDYGVGTGGGPGSGAVLRGGGVHGDNCDLHRGRGGVVYRGPVYIPQNPTVSRGPTRVVSGGSSIGNGGPSTRVATGGSGAAARPGGRGWR